MPARRLWIDTIVDQTVSASAEQFIDLTTTFITNEMRLAQMTLVRTIVGIDIAYSVHDAGEGSHQASIGICVASRDAIAAGVASLPNPAVPADFPIRPWVVRARYRIFGFAADQPTVFTRRVDLDLRSQRKLENGNLVLIMHNVAEEGAATSLLFSGMIRCLFLVS